MMPRQEYQVAKNVWKDEDRKIRGDIVRYLVSPE